MTNIDNDTPVDDALTPENVAAEADATTPTAGENDEIAKLAEQVAAVQQDLVHIKVQFSPLLAQLKTPENS
jgi:molecular chaperone GrpE